MVFGKVAVRKISIVDAGAGGSLMVSAFMGASVGYSAASIPRLQGPPLALAVECAHIPVAVFVGKNLYHLFTGLVEDSNGRRRFHLL